MSGADSQPTVRVSGLLADERRLLLVHQHRGKDDYWLLPGGVVEYGETLIVALEREMREELGLAVVAGRPLALVESLSPHMDLYAKHVIHVILETRLAPGDVAQTPVPGDPAILEARFFTGEDLARLTLRPPIGDFLSEHLALPKRRMTYLGKRW